MLSFYIISHMERRPYINKIMSFLPKGTPCKILAIILIIAMMLSDNDDKETTTIILIK